MASRRRKTSWLLGLSLCSTWISGGKAMQPGAEGGEWDEGQPEDHCFHVDKVQKDYTNGSFLQTSSVPEHSKDASAAVEGGYSTLGLLVELKGHGSNCWFKLLKTAQKRSAPAHPCR